MKLILINLILIFSFNFLTITHPLMMGLTMMIQTLLITLLLGLLMPSFWFSYILFIVFLSALLVLYIYVCSLASNEKFNFKMINNFSNIMIILLMSLMITLNMDNFLASNIDSMEFFKNMTFNEEISLKVAKIYNNNTMILTFMLMNYLFLTLIAIVKITKLNYGPLRSN